MNNAEFIDRDLKVLWHPCTQMKDHPSVLPLIPIRRGEGIWLEDFDGKRYLDAVSSWWVNLFGHCNPAINSALQDQLQQLEHVILAGFSHQPAIELAEQLTTLAPPGLSRCFYADNGASSIEIALKMSYHYWRNCDRPEKNQFVALANGYHGETIGALSVTDVAIFKEAYQGLLFDVLTVPSPDCYHREPAESWRDYSVRQFQHMEKTLAEHGDKITAVIIEPLVQCAGNMRMYHAEYLRLLRKACDKYHVHLIADEIAVGFGRTGTLFACEQAGITPDFMCLSKGLTGGYLPLSAVLTTDTIYQAFYEDYITAKSFLHSHSYTGNALACRAALATLDIFKKNNVIDNNQALIAMLRAATEGLQDHPHISEVRQCGMIVAIEFAKDKAKRVAYPWQERRNVKIYQYALSQGVLLRPTSSVVYFMPPYIITAEQITKLAQTALAAIDLATQD